MTVPRPNLRRVVTVVLALALTSCTPFASGAAPRERTTTMSAPAVRTDLNPITTRFPALGEIAQVRWLGSLAGNTGGDLPGPSDVRIQALVTLTATSREAILSRYHWQPAPADWTSKVSDDLRPFLPADATWHQSEEFTADICQHRYSGSVVVDTTSGTVYLDVIGR